MDQPIFLKILKIVVVMTHCHLKCCNSSLLINRGLPTYIEICLTFIVFFNNE